MKKIIFKINQETKFTKSIINDAPSQGPFDDYAEYLLTKFDVVVSLEDSIKYLQTLGAWEDAELQVLEENKMRLLWIAILDCKENNTQYWYMGS